MQFKNQYFENTVEPSANFTVIQYEKENKIQLINVNDF
jgi:hypothetical protein